MAVFYTLYQNNRENFANKGKWCARAPADGQPCGSETTEDKQQKTNNKLIKQ